jgi:hypothetical protein
VTSAATTIRCMMAATEPTHHLIAEADNCLKFADKVGVAVYATQASENAPARDKREDTVIIVLRGRAARRGRNAMTEIAHLILNTER